MKGKARQMPNVEKLSMSRETFVSAKTTYKITVYQPRLMVRSIP